ncbi:MAG: OmpA family protein, partial [Flavobacteriaceae bacterium]
MKRIKIVAIALFTLATIVNVNAQDANNPWAVSAGINSVDVYGGSEFFNDWLGFGDKNGNDDYNLIPTISRITAERYLSDGFTLQLAGSLNRINTVSTTDDADLVHSSVDLNLKYGLDGLVKGIFGKSTQYFS